MGVTYPAVNETEPGWLADIWITITSSGCEAKLDRVYVMPLTMYLVVATAVLRSRLWL